MYVFNCKDGVDVSFGKEIIAFSKLAEALFEDEDFNDDPNSPIQYKSEVLNDIKNFIEICDNIVPKQPTSDNSVQSLSNEKHYKYISELSAREPDALQNLIQVANFMDIQSILDIAFPYIMIRFKLTPENEFDKAFIIDEKPSEDMLEEFNKLLRTNLSLIL